MERCDEWPPRPKRRCRTDERREQAVSRRVDLVTLMSFDRFPCASKCVESRSRHDPSPIRATMAVDSTMSVNRSVTNARGCAPIVETRRRLAGLPTRSARMVHRRRRTRRGQLGSRTRRSARTRSRPVSHGRSETSRQHDAHVPRFARVAANFGSDIVRPTPTGLKMRQTDRDVAKSTCFTVRRGNCSVASGRSRFFTRISATLVFEHAVSQRATARAAARRAVTSAPDCPLGAWSGEPGIAHRSFDPRTALRTPGPGPWR